MVDFNFYQQVYQGCSVSSEEWMALEPRAADQLARYKRTYTVNAPDENAESMAVCAMVEALAYFVAAQNGAGGAVSSASIGSVSVSYGNSAGTVDISAKGQAKELYRCASLYLDIYRGVGGC